MPNETSSANETNINSISEIQNNGNEMNIIKIQKHLDVFKKQIEKASKPYYILYKLDSRDYEKKKKNN